MEINTKYPSPLILEEIVILEGSFKRTEAELSNENFNFDVKRSIEKKDNNRYAIILDAEVENEDASISIIVKCRGKFRTEQENRDLIERNAIAIMFPYLRSYISTITTQPGMLPIVLPAMNIISMLNDDK